MHRRSHLIALLLIAIAAAPAAAELPDAFEQYAVLMSGDKKIGYVHGTRTRDGDTVLTETTMVLRMGRGPTAIEVTTITQERETIDGAPLSLKSVTTAGPLHREIVGVIADGRLDYTATLGDQTKQGSLEWPDDALLAEGQRLAILALDFEPGATCEFQNFNDDSLSFMRQTITMGSPEQVDLLGGAHRDRLPHERQRIVVEVLELARGARLEVERQNRQALPLGQQGVVGPFERPLLGLVAERGGVVEAPVGNDADDLPMERPGRRDGFQRQGRPVDRFAFLRDRGDFYGRGSSSHPKHHRCFGQDGIPVAGPSAVDIADLLVAAHEDGVLLERVRQLGGRRRGGDGDEQQGDEVRSSMHGCLLPGAVRWRDDGTA